jgi:UDP-GlcNAc:undecaprenyl-phosphate GlcNAc-1-phosphate transferase
MLEVLALAVVTSIVLSLVLTPLVMKLAVAIGAVDAPDARKIHKKIMPRMGGVAVFVSFGATIILLHFVFPFRRLSEWLPAGGGIIAEIADPGYIDAWLLLVISFLSIVTLGVLDDIYSLKPGKKFLVQILAGVLVFLAGFQIDSITNPFSGGTIHMGILTFPVTVLWVVGITNAFNLIDGLDGLASGIALIAGVTMSSVALLHHDATAAVIGFSLAGAIVGFLRYNFNPAKIFLGDSGSLFLGFTLSVLSIKSATKGTAAFSVIIPLLALGVPIMDTALAMLRRVLRSFLPEQSDQPSNSSLMNKLHSMFLPDRRHIHHQLLAHGFSHRDAVIVLYMISCAFGFSAFLVTAGSLSASLVLIVVGVAIVIAIRKLGYKEMALLRNGLILQLYNRTFLKHGVTQVFFDMLSVFVAFLVARLITTPFVFVSATWREWGFGAIVVSIVQLLAFMKGGLYRRSVDLFGLGDFLQILKATFVGVVATGCILEFLVLVPILRQVNGDGPPIGLFALLDFYFLITLVVGSRVAFHAMNYIFRREASNCNRALIYGADNKGMIVLQTLLAEQQMISENGGSQPRTSPIGFLDDNPLMEGKFLDGYPVFGGHWKLEGLLNKLNICEIILANKNINPTALERIRDIAERRNVRIRISQNELKEFSPMESDEKFLGHQRGKPKQKLIPSAA